ncbi:hypothetical protein [Cognatiyoonia sp. IB215182]|uniref:hypothetical protein n=1 Tax=Cognatiyoonia sp. IB215182 TaxID=3097353 RepID=UPI002A142F33|nr:hypothetical protein [Cognatiyoonia sp. IB215182]MDX8353658.1 hypothetical protein [Cognatiyoonia sp. IB215182]
MLTIPEMEAKLHDDIFAAVERALADCYQQNQAAAKLGVTPSWLTRYCQKHSDRLAASEVFTGWKRDDMIRKHRYRR